MTNSDDIEIEAAWLYFVEGLTQAQIATRRGLSRMRVHRLIQAAQEKGYVKIFVDRVPSHCTGIENELIDRFCLTRCTIATAAHPRSRPAGIGPELLKLIAER